MHDATLLEILTENKIVAVVGLSPKPDRASHRVAQYLQRMGYRIIPVNPGFDEILGERSYARLEDIPQKVDIVDVFRKSEDTPPVAESAVRIGARVLWLQLGIANEVAASIAQTGGLTVVQDRCIKIEHERLLGQGGEPE
ncbi:MAG: CoA-binding protein [Sulfobacillus sp.]